MSPRTSSPCAATDATALAERCLAHAAREEAFLTVALEALRRVRVEMSRGDVNALAAELRGQEAAIELAEQVRQDREAFRRELADMLQVASEAATLEKASGLLPEAQRRRLTAARRRVRSRAEEVRRLQRTNTIFIQYHLDFLQRFFVDVSGGPTGPGRYGRAGTLQTPACGSLIRAQG